MKLIIAYVKEERFTQVKSELDKADVHRMSVSRIRGSGQQKGYVESYRGAKKEINLMPKIRLEIAINDSFVEKVVGAISEGARTGSIGDGKILVLPLEDCVRIRTGEHGIKAIGGKSEELEKERDMAFSKSVGKTK